MIRLVDSVLVSNDVSLVGMVMWYLALCVWKVDVVVCVLMACSVTGMS